MPKEGAPFRPSRWRPWCPGCGTGPRRRTSRRRPTRGSTGRSARPCGRRCRSRKARTCARWVRNPIDAFVAAEYERHGLKPRPEADRATLLRRVYLDLTGLPADPQSAAGVPGTTTPRTPTRRWWTSCWPAPATASGGAGTGWTCGATATGPASCAEVREQPAVLLAVARLGDRVAQRRRALRPHGDGHAGRRRGRAAATPRPCARPATWPATTTSSTATSGWTPPSSTRPRRSWA